MQKLYEIIIPTRYPNDKKIPTKDHKEWDRLVQKISGGLTVMAASKGKWVFNAKEYHEKVIPVRVMCDESKIDELIDFTIAYYKQLAVMYYVVSAEVHIRHAKP